MLTLNIKCHASKESALGPFSICAFPQAETSLVHLCVTVSMIAFPRGGNYPRAETLLDERLFRARCPYRHNAHAHDLELVKTMKMPSDDQANSVIPQTRFCVHGNTLFLLRKRALKRASRNAHMEMGPYINNYVL